MKNRRGISSVVGTVFAIIALATTIGYITYSMNVLDNYNQAVLQRNQQTTDIANEKLQVTGATFVNNKLNITVANTGTLPVNFTKVWITNSSVSPNAKPWVKSYSVNSIVTPGNTTKNIGQSAATWLNTGYSYHVKLVTSRGNTLPFSINAVNKQTLGVNVFTSPPTVSNQFDTQLIMTVTNNATNAGIITNLNPITPTVDTSSCSPACTATYVSGPIPASYNVLQPGQTATFKWQYTITGAAANTISFNTGILNGGNSNTGTSSVVVRDIVSSLTSGSTLQSVGLLTGSATNSTIFMHTETNNVPSSKYQLMPPNADASGTTKTGFPNLQFFTNNATTGTRVMYAGTMNASFRYTNDRLASGVSDNSDSGHILHFNRNYCQTLPCDRPIDSTQNGNNQCYNDVDNTVSGQPSSNTNRPTVSATFGINGSNGANFNGVQWYTINADTNCNSPTNNKFSMTAWFNANTNGPAAAKQTIWRLGTGATQYIEVVLGDGTSGNKGRVYFTFDANGVATQCSSTATTYMDGKWHHLAAIRTGDYSCQMYIDGTLQSGPGATGSSGNNIIPSGPVSIGRFPSTTQTCCTNPYYGSLDDILFWNSHQLSSSEVTSVKNTNYGTGAFTAGFVLDKTNSVGVKLSNIIPLTFKSMPFSDKEHWSSSTSNSPDRQYYWVGGNYSLSLPQITLNPGERLNFTFYKSSGLNADVRLDDSSFTGINPDPYSSFIQYKGSNSTLPSYLQYNRCNPLDVIVYNQGPYGSWVTYQGTRVTFNNLYGTDSYAGIVHYVNGSRLYSSQDSMFLPVGSTNTFEFYPINNIPNQNNGNYCSNNPPYISIPDGTYDMNLFISGYDENGGSFLRQVPFGTVTVYG